jgi:hypothetical protein
VVAVTLIAYATVDELKDELKTSVDTRDAMYQSKLDAASRRVDKDTGRPHGYGQDTGVTSRIYRPTHPELLLVDDVSTSVGLVVEVGRGTTWSTVDSGSYDQLPENAEADGRAIEVLRRAVGCWPLWGAQRVRVTAKWGWPAVPDEIKNATLLLAQRLLSRKDSPTGVQGFSDLGVVRVSRYDPDYDALIGSFVRDVT